MSHRRQLLARYSRRDRLSMVVIGVSIAFLTGSALLLVSATDQLGTIAADFDTTGYVTGYQSIESAARTAGSDAVFPIATVPIDGTNVTVLGVPPGANETITAATPDAGLASALTNGPRTVEVRGTTVKQIQISGRPSIGVIPDSWYLAESTLVEQFTTDGAVVVETGANAVERTGVRGGSIPLRGAAHFFVSGTRDALSLFGVIVAGVAGLVGVIVFSVTRMSVRDRAKTIRVVRATGGTPRAVRALFTARATIVTLVGITIGYAVGLIAARVAVNVSVFLGVPVSLNLSLSWPVLHVLVPLYGGVLLTGALAGYLASRPVSRLAPVQIRSSGGDAPTTGRGVRDRLPGWLRPTLLGFRAVIPTIATITVFLTLLIVLVSAGTAMAPMVDSEAATIAEPGSSHPVASEVPESFATVLEGRGIAASPEILLFSIADGKPTLMRGVNFSSFATVSDASLVTGRAPRSSDEAVVGAAIAARRNLSVGDTVLLGGSTRSAFTRTTIVGVFDAPGFYGSQLLVSLSTGRTLSTRGPRQVHVVRASRLPDVTGSGIEVVDVSTPGTVVQGRNFRTSITAINLGRTNATRSITIRVANASRNVTLSVPPGGRTERSVTLSIGRPGSWSLVVGSTNQSITVEKPDALRVWFPEQVRVGSTPRVEVATATGEPVANATVTLGNRTVRTDSAGVARITVPPGGTHLSVTAGSREVTEPVTGRSDRSGGEDPLLAALSIEPESPGFRTQPTASVRLENPWNRTLSTTLTIRGPTTSHQRAVTLDPGATTTVSAQLSRQPPGEYAVTVTDEAGAVLARRSMVVTGDERLVAALATHGQQGSTPFSRAVSLLFGNLTLLVGAIVSLGALMTVGGLTAIFSRGIHARRRTIGIYRATGATPRQVFTLVVRDAVVIGTAALGVAFPLAYLVLTGLTWTDVLTVFGVSIRPLFVPWVVVMGMATVLSLVVFGAVLATATLLRPPPARALTGERTGGDDR
ncbi:ABC-type antimicrobial peptide transport system,permease component [Halorhabdus sp. SVX81]|uniref:FtsX-like permease family protein n=1 Tax=Halorhabdus sp. SVX81 TaxID=2978283 RepID=UPI0023DB1EC2|nr:FtsX-like permease family protein [Halorhabdus sp. SVX81]WEL16710.1 ABC-type antimicrobial peptide transport system,permease component [Halorhabdus sp. SVX81]